MYTSLVMLQANGILLTLINSPFLLPKMEYSSLLLSLLMQSFVCALALMASSGGSLSLWYSMARLNIVVVASTKIV